MKLKFLLFMYAALSINLSSRAQAVTTVAPTILGTYTLGIAVGTNDTLYVENQSDFRIYKIDPSGTASIFVGDGSYGTTDGTGTSASIQYVYDLEYSHTSGNLYFTQHGRRASTQSNSSRSCEYLSYCVR